MARKIPRARSDCCAGEIQVTPEMIQAGVSELARFHLDFEDEASAVERIYRAMCASRFIAFSNRRANRAQASR